MPLIFANRWAKFWDLHRDQIVEFVPRNFWQKSQNAASCMLQVYRNKPKMFLFFSCHRPLQMMPTAPGEC